MTSITFFFFLIPVLAVVLLAVNLIFAPHIPYAEKNSVFECGFHSFLGQNRMQFNISFYIFGLLFLLFDLEILLIYPYPVSSYFNSIYGLTIMLVFFLVLTLGFTFELGKNALKIDSRQYENNEVIYKPKQLVESNLVKFKLIYFLLTWNLPLFVLRNLLYITYALYIVSLIFNNPILCDYPDAPDSSKVTTTLTPELHRDFVVRTQLIQVANPNVPWNGPEPNYTDLTNRALEVLTRAVADKAAEDNTTPPARDPVMENTLRVNIRGIASETRLTDEQVMNSARESAEWYKNGSQEEGGALNALSKILERPVVTTTPTEEEARASVNNHDYFHHPKSVNRPNNGTSSN